MSKKFYYKEIKILYYIIMSIILMFFLGMLMKFLINLSDISYAILFYALVFYGIIYIFSILFFFFDYYRLIKNVRRLEEECDNDKLLEYIQGIDAYYQPRLNKGAYFGKKLMLKSLLVLVYIRKDNIDEAERIHTEAVPYVDRKLRYLHDEITFRFLFLAIQSKRKNIELIEEEIGVIKERMLLFKRRRMAEIFRARMKYYEVRLDYLKGNYDGLDEILQEVIEQEKNVQSILQMRFGLGEIYMKQGKNKEACNQFSFILEYNKNYHLYQEAKKYFEQLTE